MIELDSVDRLNIPGSLRQDANIDKEIVVVGSGDFIEIWDATTYKNIDNDAFDYEAVAKNLLGNTKE